MTSTPGSRRGSRRHRIDRHVHGIGRVRFDAPSPSRLRVYRVLLDKLIQNDATDTIKALLRGDLTWGDLERANQEGRLLQATDRLKLRVPLVSAAERVFDPERITEHTYLRSLRKLEGMMRDQGLEPTVERLADMPWEDLASSWPWSGTHWNQIRAAVRRLISRVTYRGHPFWLEMRSRFPRLPEVIRQPDVSPAMLEEVKARMPATYRAMVAFGVLTGLRPDELARYRPSWLAEDAYLLRVQGTKTAYAVRELVIDPRLWGEVREIKRVRITGLRYWLRKASESAGLPRLQRWRWSVSDAEVLKLLVENGVPLAAFFLYRAVTEERRRKVSESPATAEPLLQAILNAVQRIPKDLEDVSELVSKYGRACETANRKRYRLTRKRLVEIKQDTSAIRDRGAA